MAAAAAGKAPHSLLRCHSPQQLKRSPLCRQMWRLRTWTRVRRRRPLQPGQTAAAVAAERAGPGGARCGGRCPPWSVSQPGLLRCWGHTWSRCSPTRPPSRCFSAWDQRCPCIAQCQRKERMCALCNVWIELATSCCSLCMAAHQTTSGRSDEAVCGCEGFETVQIYAD